MTDRHRARKGETAPVRPHLGRAIVETITVPADGAVAMFASLVDALDIKDYRTAAAIRRRLYRAGWSIVPPRSPSWRGGPHG